MKASDHYQVGRLGISIFVKPKESLYFWMNSSGDKKPLKHRLDSPSLSRKINFLGMLHKNVFTDYLVSTNQKKDWKSLVTGTKVYAMKTLIWKYLRLYLTYKSNKVHIKKQYLRFTCLYDF